MTNKLRILVVEDDIIVSNHIQDTLMSLNYEVAASAHSGEKAIQEAASIQPDLALIDIVLKGEIDGIEAAEQIRNRFDIPVVYLTAYSDPDTLNRAISTEPFGYITKPFKEKDLYITIRMAYHKHQIEKETKQQIQAVDTYLSKKIEHLMKEYQDYTKPTPSEPNLLTSREQEILQLIVEGKSTKEIATQLSVSNRTVEAHRYHIMHKLEVDGIASLISYAITHKLVPSSGS